MIKTITFLLLMQITSTAVFSQGFYLYGDKTFGGSSSDRGLNILERNSEIIIAGLSWSDISGDKMLPLCNPLGVLTSDIWILKIDTAFNILWQTNIGGDTQEADPFFTFTRDSLGIIFSCDSYSDSSCTKSENNKNYPLTNTEDYWIGKLDNGSNLIWEKTLGGTGEDEGVRIQELSTGEFIVAGGSNSPIGGDKSQINYGGRDFWLLKTDSMGNKIWDFVYGGTAMEECDNEWNHLLPLDNGNFIWGGTTYSPMSGNISDTSRGSSDIWLVHIDNTGNIIWDKRFGGSGTEKLYYISHTSDNGFIICGTTSSPQSGEVSDTSRGGSSDIWVIKIDSAGNKIWDKRFGGNFVDYASKIVQDYEGGYWLAGSTNSDAGGEVSESPYGHYDYWILKLDSAGNKLWDKRFGGPGNNYLSDFTLLADSSIMLFGTAGSGTTSTKTDPGEGTSDYWLVHFKYQHLPNSINELNHSIDFVSIFPNPTFDLISITSNGKFIAEEFLLFDVAGRMKMKHQINKDATIDVGMLSPAMYFYEVRDKSGKKINGKILKL